MATLKTRFQLRHGTSESWTTSNPILLEGEVGVETDTNKLKIGDGKTAWKDLKYSGADENDILKVIDDNRGTHTELELTEDQTPAEALATITTPKKGDTAVVVETIGADKKSYTAYIYDGENWKAMDGNYRADNVYFDDDITYTVAIGTLAKPSGSAKFAAKGKNVEQVFSSLMAQEANPSAVKPEVTIGTQTNFGTFEIGTVKNLVYGATLSAGSYTYGPATGITAQTWEATCTGVTASKSAASGTFEGVVAEASAKNITVKATYNQGAMPKTNLGNDYAAARIAAGTATKTTGNLIGVRYMFWGPMTDADAALNSANIRALAHNKATGTGTLTTFGAGAGAKKVVVAVPSGRKITKVTMPSALNADVTALFVKQTNTVSVEGANNYAGAAYDVYVYQPASIDAGETYSVVIG